MNCIRDFSRRLAAISAVALVPTICLPLSAQADDAFPSKPLRIVVPFPPGGTADLLPRALAERISPAWKQTIIIENRPGASGNIGAKAVADAPPDGHTLLVSTPGPVAINQSLYKSLPFDANAFVHSTLIATSPIVLTVRATLPVNTVQELIRHAASQPGRLSYASSGAGSTPHLVASMFATAANVQLLHVPYKGTSPAVADLIGGPVDIYFDNLANALQHHRNGRVRILGVASNRRAALLPEVPTLAESGLADFSASTWYAAVLPPNTPGAVASRWNQAINEALASPDIQRRFTEWGLDAVGGTPQEAASFVRSEVSKWKKVVDDAKVSVE